MSVQLKLDEMLEVLQGIDGAEAASMERLLTACGDRMAERIAAHFDCRTERATMQGQAFGGICSPFYPAHRGQECPEALVEHDEGGMEDWDREADSLPPRPMIGGGAHPRRENVGDLSKASYGFVCNGCGRPEADCSPYPCAAVLTDREL
jgi:hypothetical protein